jgi:hypothetical protein
MPALSSIAFLARVSCLLLVLAGATAVLSAHDIPADVVVQAYLRPEGRRLHTLVRVPLGAMRDVQFPLRGPGYLELAKADEFLREAALTWIRDSLVLYENGERILEPPDLVSYRVSLPSDRSFATYEGAVTRLTGPVLPLDTEMIWNQALFDVWFDFPIRADTSEFAMHPGFARLGVRVATVLRFQQPGKVERVFEYLGDPGFVRLDPRWHQAAARFVALGFAHILDGIDHLLFLLCLVLPFRQLKPLVIIVTSFTVAHSITLIASAMDVAPGALWFPPLIETLIAASIVYMALENIVGVTNVTRRWVITFAFGLVHGFGFSFALRETLQFAGSHLLTSLVAFNVGVELGQLLVLALLIPALHFAFRHVVAERMGIIIVSALVAHTAWHWMIERGAGLGGYDWSGLWPDSPGKVVRWILAAVMVAAAAWLVRTAKK